MRQRAVTVLVLSNLESPGGGRAEASAQPVISQASGGVEICDELDELRRAAGHLGGLLHP